MNFIRYKITAAISSLMVFALTGCYTQLSAVDDRPDPRVTVVETDDGDYVDREYYDDGEYYDDQAYDDQAYDDGE